MPYAAKEYSLDLLSEENIKKYVLPEYNLENSQLTRIKFKDTDKQRAVYKLDYLNNTYCLKKVYFSKEELLFIYSAIEWLHRNNICVPKILPTKDRGRFVEYNNMLFILTPWINGVKCSYDKKEHVLASINNLSHMHYVCKNFNPINESKIRKGEEDIRYSVTKHFQQLLSCSNSAFKYGDRFSKLFLQHFETNLLLSEISVRVSSSINVRNLSLSLCHLDYVNKNILFDSNNKVWVIDFDKCCIDYCTHDISYFLRRLLKREKTNWDLDLALQCLNVYENTNILNLDEYKYILAYLSFPQKFWRISRDYYNNMVKCNHNSFFYLLEKATQADKEHLDFILKLGKFIENRFQIRIT
ncbi:CotS family spore coat protein [Clostridium sp. DJ247]|uniref:CotS family spore coat protein n=1 Tax=Clostridium sp. DJ247 TaxID=2726188 RepID=UPI001625FA19|nr:CotS family spore coat protein [Clostridium sp. DJ247]MBC2579231.1 CotS family spore coat protein [Clostridium sp. DJ247]MBC2579318.1 CotS family spore coat protein [Clostridium sp. DJ247]